MSNIVALPNGSNWDNDLQFTEQDSLAQYWYFETLMKVMQGIASGNLPTDVKRLDYEPKNGATREDMYYSKLERDDLILTVDQAYKHKDWERVLNEGYEVPMADWMNAENYVFAEGIKFEVNEKEV